MKNILTLLLLISINKAFAQTTTGTRSQNPKDPTASVAGSSGGKIAAAIFKAAKRIDVRGPDSSATVTSCTIYFERKGFEEAPGMLENVIGHRFGKDAAHLLERCQPGTIVTIDDIKVMSGNVIKKVPTIIFTLY